MEMTHETCAPKLRFAQTSKPMDLHAIVSQLNSEDYKFMIEALVRDYGECPSDDEYYDYEEFEANIDSMDKIELTDFFLEYFHYDGLDDQDFDGDKTRLPPEFLTESLQKALGLEKLLKDNNAKDELRSKLVWMIKEINLSLGNPNINYADLEILIKAVDAAYKKLGEAKEHINNWQTRSESSSDGPSAPRE